MKVALDSSALVRWSAKRDDDDGVRLEALFADCTGLIIPAPAFAEFLAGERGDDRQWIEELARKPRLRLAAFGLRAAYECAGLDRRPRAIVLSGKGKGKRDWSRENLWQKIKLDRQILAIALVEGCELLVSDDDGLQEIAKAHGMQALAVSQLPIPPSAAQRKLDLEANVALTELKSGAPKPPAVSKPKDQDHRA